LVWRLRVGSPGAYSLNLGFSVFQMPEDGRLLIYAADRSAALQPFTAQDNADHGELWTPVVLTDEVVIEVVLPASAQDDLYLELTSVNVGYRGFTDPPELRSGYCNIDVVCPEGDDWRDEIQSVGVYTLSGLWTCTGVMVNNTAGDETPYFLTADHCGINSSNDSTMVVYWNFQSPTCGQQGGGSLMQNQTGAYFRADYSASDVTLVELDSDPNPAHNVMFAGWDRSTANPTSAVAIHHPSTDEKSISFENNPCTTTSYYSSSSPGDGTHIRVADWDLGTTEPGSSGSPLFNQNHHIVGQLHGGDAACGNNSPDWYGRFSSSWAGGGTNSTRLSNWLDPLGTGVTTLDMLGSAGTEISFPSGLPAALAPGSPETFDVEVVSSGETTVPGSPTLHYRYSGGAYLTDSLAHVSGNLYTATLPAADCDDTPEFYFSAQGSTTGYVYEPEGAPGTVYTALVGVLTTIMDDDFETDQGWTVTDSVGLVEGTWERGIPLNNDRGDPPSDYDGSDRCYLTENDPEDTNSDVDDGTTTVTSPVLDMSNGGTITYAYWLNDISTGPLGEEDSMTVEVAIDAAGDDWATVRSYTTALGSWRTDAIEVGTEVTASATVRIRFSASDLYPGDVVEGGLDAFLARSLVCESGATCDDGILNQGEDRIDCGGPCPACECTSDGACDNVVFCDGAETCDAYGDCQTGGDPCAGTHWCKESADSCILYGDGDFEPDGDVDLDDFANFQVCYGQIANSLCEPGNLNGTGTIDSADYAAFAASLAGPD
ncbi:MAG: S1 family peptidase, partial [bacterium]|nr:S1 family peptidase [bacterium]